MAPHGRKFHFSHFCGLPEGYLLFRYLLFSCHQSVVIISRDPRRVADVSKERACWLGAPARALLGFGWNFRMPLFGRQHVRLPIVNWSQVVQRPESRQAPTTRDIDCPHCGEPLRVAIRAINTRCTACHRHLRLEDVVIRGESPLTRVVTCGSILIEPSAKFQGTLQGSEIVIAGLVLGTVIGTQRVEVTSTGKVAGTVATRHLQVHDAALIDGQINILNADNTISTHMTTADHHVGKGE